MVSADRSGKPMTGVFQVEYDGPGETLWVQAGAILNPAYGGGGQRQVTIRGHEAYLNIEVASNPTKSAWLYWQEPGKYLVDGATTTSGFYELRAKGIDPDTLISIAESLVPYP